MMKKIANMLTAIMALILLPVAIPTQPVQANIAWLDVTRTPESQGYTREGSGGSCTLGYKEIILSDDSVSHIYYQKVVPDIATRHIDLLVWLRISYSRLYNSDTGVRIVLDEGPGGKRIEVGFRQDERGPVICLRMFIDGEYQWSTGQLCPWGSGALFVLRKDSSGATLLSPEGYVLDAITREWLIPSSLSQPRFEFGCYSDQAEVTAGFMRIEEITPPTSYPIDINLTQVQVFTQGSKKVQVQGEFTLDGGSPGIDPVADGVALRLKLQGGNQFYPNSGSDFMPVMMEETNAGWTISESEKKRTGIEDFEVLRTADPRKFIFKLVDTRTGIADGDYPNITLSLVIGNNEGGVNHSLSGSKGKYRYP